MAPTVRHAAAAAVLVAASGLAAVPAVAAEGCPPPPPAIRDIDAPRYYTDKSGSAVDPELLDANRIATGPLKRFLGDVTALADKAHTRPGERARAQAARCALAWLVAWAKADAYLGRMASAQAEYQRKWDLAGVSLAYLKFRRHADGDQRATIEPWLDRWADLARAFFDEPGRKRNNHWYWLGLALGGTALATGSERHWSAAAAIMADAARDIAADGTLAMELARGARALHYHVFSVMPLVALAELGRARGSDWRILGNGALDRLVQITAAGLADPGLFDRLAGTVQERPVNPGAGWALLVSRWSSSPAGLARLPAIKTSHRWLGGDVGVLIEALKRTPVR